MAQSAAKKDHTTDEEDGLLSLLRDQSPSLANLAKDFAYGRRFVVWIGSGLSIPAGLPSWSTLRKKLENRLTASAERRLPGITDQQRAAIVNSIRKLPDFWDAFEALKFRLGYSEYRQIIELGLSDSLIEKPPSSLTRLWQSANIDGIISLNIDNLASRAFAEVNQGRRELARANGNSLQLGLRYLSGHQQFLVQLHGKLEDENSWVFTRSELANLFSRQDYTNFVRTAISSRRILFIGCSPDDFAVAKHFESLANITPNPPHHYWFVPSHEISGARENTLSKLGVNLVEYTINQSLPVANQNIEHNDSILELFDYLERFQYIEAEPEPINPMAGPIGARLPPDRVQALQPEQARNILSRYATSILDQSGQDKFQIYQKFLEDYGTAIAVASHVSKTPGSLVFGHEVTGELGEGAFSRVLSAIAADGYTKRAIKLVRNEVRDDPQRLRSFRRGVRSMKILSDKNISGMVAYEEAHEIPPCVIMPFIDGETLEQMVSRSDFSFLEQGIPILYRVAQIVQAAHNLSERVLHRDLRPSNIMISKDNGTSSLSDRVCVLDFDLSWHEGADADAPISPNMTTVLGYLAPEQIADDLSVSARHSRVDTFGLCMTVFFALQRQHPDFNARSSNDWNNIKTQLGRQIINKTKWSSLLPRIRRLVDAGTNPAQKDRISFEYLTKELLLFCTLKNVQLSDMSQNYAAKITLEALAEEILASALPNENYEWDSVIGRGSYLGSLGVVVEISVGQMNGERSIIISIRKQSDGTQSFATVKKYWPGKQKEIGQIMRKAGWEFTGEKPLRRDEIFISYYAPQSIAWSMAVRLRDGFAQARQKLSMT